MTIKKAIAAVAVTVGSTGAWAGTAFAATGPATAGKATLSAVQTKAAAAIAARVSALNSAVSAVSANKELTSAEQAPMLQILNSDLTALNALGPKIASDTTVTEALADYQSIFTSYRVFALAIPQVRMAAAADDLAGGVLPRLTDAQSKLQAILSGPDSSKDTGSVAAAMNDLANQITGIGGATSSLATTVLAFTPPQWNANHDLLGTSRSQLVTARADAKAARQDISTVLSALR